MKYISFIDQLGLDIESLSNIDSNGIIKLQKQLKAKAMLGDANNLGEVAHLIEKLKDDTTRQSYVFIEKHDWLKQLISGNHKAIKQAEIEVDTSLITNEEDLKYFLAPFLKDNLKVFLSDTLNKGKYVLLLKVLDHNYLFSEENNQLVINFLKARLNYAAVYLREKRLNDKEHPVAFITNKVFINCLNQYPDNFNQEIQELNSEVIDIYNSKRRNVDNQQFRFAAKAMVAFSVLETSNFFLAETLKSNANIAREYTYPSRSSRKTGSGFGGWSAFVIIMIVIRIIFWVSKDSKKSNYDYINGSNYSSQPIYNDAFQRKLDSLRTLHSVDDILNVEETVIESTESTETEPNYDRFKLADHTKFIYTLKRKVERKNVDKDGYIKPLDPFSNPYPKTFTVIPHKTEDIDNSLVKITNRTKEDLIVFRLTNGIDQSLYIPKNQSTFAKISDQDSLVFYTGRHFVSTKFSHFIEDTDLSNMLVVNKENDIPNSEISIYPFKDKISKVNSSSSNKILIDTTRVEQIKAKNLNLKPLSINKLYTDYYNRKYRR
ncbi:hypothetical protein [Psychroserpens algicola]|uniref:Uncharacterized protein n=1 Tax=Psychroserpens algicola TaxID=1719034 RepID=A0ABT0HD03_9FLAO|nr:hypothetical protein [Psychroserpens algicola]MCK8482249.1 hypothetical protein [Psychroserpens algicola]